ncbi:MAG: hypothetical protein FP814_09790 [Desulfobacterium sp.]|nr:hypothetical protein [Desulfobacterium sp.]
MKAHPGVLTESDVKTILVNTPTAIRVGCMGIPAIARTDMGVEYTLSWAAYILAQDRAGAPRDETAMTAAVLVAGLVAGNVWGRDDLESPVNITADNLYSGALDNRLIALWAVTWRQAWTPEGMDASTLDDLLRVVVDWDVNPEAEDKPAPTDTIELAGGSVL